MTDKAREEFEAFYKTWWSVNTYTFDFENGKYIRDYVQMAFVTWQHQQAEIDNLQARVEELEAAWREVDAASEKLDDAKRGFMQALQGEGE